MRLVQLPVPEVQDLYAWGNIPLAAGYLKAYAVSKGVVETDEIQIIPGNIANYGGDAALLNALTQPGPALAGFGTYLWNLDRNLYLARQLKESNPHMTTLLGGPEIDTDHHAIDLPFIDAVVVGEGEQAFVDFLKDWKNGRTRAAGKRVYRSQTPVNLHDVPNPYLGGILKPVPGQSIFFETMRGCPYPCKYCFYSKSYSGMRYFPESMVPDLFSLARDYRVPEVYLMDPSFEVTPDLEKKLETIRRANSTHIPIHTEMRLEAVTPGIADAMAAAGIASVEVGLQSVNTKSLEAIGRPWNRKAFTRGAQLLQNLDIDVKTGVILGLPYDGFPEILETLDLVMDLGLEASMELYPLALLPGTALRDEAPDLGINYMKHPPYWATSTNRLDQKELKRVVELVEQKLEIEFFPPIVPHFKNFHPLFTHFLDLRETTAQQLNELYRFPEKIGHSLTVLAGPNTGSDQLAGLGEWLKQTNPFTLVQVVMDRDEAPSMEEIARLSSAFFTPRHYFNHIHHYKIDPQGQYSLRFFHLTAHPETAEAYLYQPLYCDLVVRYTPQLLSRGRDILEANPILLVDSPIGPEEETQLQDCYQNFENLLIFI